MIINEIFKDFLINLAENSHIWGEIFEIMKKTLEDFEKKLEDFEKTQCYGVGLTQCDSLKPVRNKVLDNQSQFMNSPCGDPNKELNHKEENQK